MCITLNAESDKPQIRFSLFMHNSLRHVLFNLFNSNSIKIFPPPPPPPPPFSFPIWSCGLFPPL